MANLLRSHCVFIIVAVALISHSTGSGEFFLGFQHYTNRDNRAVSGQCCDGDSVASSCPDFCDLIFEVTVMGIDGGATLSRLHPGKPIGDTNDFQFISNGAMQPMVYMFQKWTGGITINVVVYDVDLPGSKPEVVDEFMIPFSQSSETSIYSLVRGIGNRPFNSSSLELFGTYRCSFGYYGDDCATDCIRNPVPGICPGLPRTTTLTALPSTTCRPSVVSVSPTTTTTTTTATATTTISSAFISKSSEAIDRSSTRRSETSTPLVVSEHVTTNNISLLPETTFDLSTTTISSDTTDGSATLGEITKGSSQEVTKERETSTPVGGSEHVIYSNTSLLPESTATSRTIETTSSDPTALSTQTQPSLVNFTSTDSIRTTMNSTGKGNHTFTPGVANASETWIPSLDLSTTKDILTNIMTRASQSEQRSTTRNIASVPATKASTVDMRLSSTNTPISKTAPSETTTKDTLPSDTGSGQKTTHTLYNSTRVVRTLNTEPINERVSAGNEEQIWPVIVGAVVGGLALIALVVIFVYVKKQRHLRTKQDIYNVNPRKWQIPKTEENGTSGRSDLPLETEIY
ncbi:hypothetical protein ScPMuIL_017857 [Solemya velum]